MSLGYLIIAIPTPTPVSSLPLYLTLTCVGLLVIAFGNGLFKGNLQALVGQMYDNKEFSAKRESGFQIFYMFINIGGFFAPFVAIGVRNWWLKVNNFDYNAKLPELCHEYLAKGEHMAGEGLANLTSYANSAYLDGTPVSAAGLHDFCNGYLDVFNRGFHYAFIAAIVMMLVSLVIYLSNKQRFPDPSKKAAAGGAKASAEEITMSAQEIRQRIYALFAVFGVVIFFWVSFHQNGYSLTYFARDYVNLDVININLGFTTIKGAEIFQSVNPFFVVTLTPLIMWFFGWLRKRNIEVSTPMKIAHRYGYRRHGLPLPDVLLVRTARQGRPRRHEGRPGAVDPGDPVGHGGPLFHPYRRRALHLAPRTGICIEGGAPAHAGPYAGLLAGRYGRGQCVAVRRRMALHAHPDVGYVVRLRRSLRHVDARHALDGALARTGDEITPCHVLPMAAADKPQRLFFRRRCVGRIPRVRVSMACVPAAPVGWHAGSGSRVPSPVLR